MNLSEHHRILVSLASSINIDLTDAIEKLEEKLLDANLRNITEKAFWARLRDEDLTCIENGLTVLCNMSREGDVEITRQIDVIYNMTRQVDSIRVRIEFHI